jgi:hypothetical protein
VHTLSADDDFQISYEDLLRYAELQEQCFKELKLNGATDEDIWEAQSKLGDLVRQGRRFENVCELHRELGADFLASATPQGAKVASAQPSTAMSVAEWKRERERRDKENPGWGNAPSPEDLELSRMRAKIKDGSLFATFNPE